MHSCTRDPIRRSFRIAEPLVEGGARHLQRALPHRTTDSLRPDGQPEWSRTSSAILEAAPFSDDPVSAAFETTVACPEAPNVEKAGPGKGLRGIRWSWASALGKVAEIRDQQK